MNLKVGMDITQLHYSDRTCWYITKVVDEKHFFAKPYHICADHEKEGGQGHQNWLYFKSEKEMNDYLDKFYPIEHNDDIEDKDVEFVYRYNNWYETFKDDDKRQYSKVRLSFDVRNYYYDWEF